LPFAALLLAIALLPLGNATRHWWERNSSKLAVALGLGAVTCLYYLLRDHGFHAEPGAASLLQVLNHAVLKDYIPFIVLLFSLYTIGGGINVSGDIPAHPLTNVAVLLIGALLASVIGTTGAAMLLIRPLLQINSERHRVTHTVVFFIFLVCNIGGCLLPIGDPPLFLGYLRGVPFLWTLRLAAEWATCTALVLAVYFVWDTVEHHREARRDLEREERVRVPIRVSGKRNLWLLGGVVAAVGVLMPGRALPILGWNLPDAYVREAVQLALAGLSLWITPWGVRRMNNFNFKAIFEVAALFIGIFVTMQVPIEFLSIRGAELHLTEPWQFFWATGALSSFLDNAPTYVVYFSAAGALHAAGAEVMHGVDTATGSIAIPLLKAISCGSVFMGAMTYIGNGPNFMVKSIAEQSGVRMPSFFGYMAYSVVVLVPVFLLVTWLFFVP
jgi:Na+/H+ antiporter NhaD/arsenite permease-like protein